MTATSPDGFEYLAICVSEHASCLACAMSNGKIDLFNLDQAMRDLPIQGCHQDVITAMCFIDANQLLISGDDSGAIMAWFVRPSRWKGQLAFTLHTPNTPKASQTAAEKLKEQEQEEINKRNAAWINDDPIRQVNGLGK